MEIQHPTIPKDEANFDAHIRQSLVILLSNVLLVLETSYPSFNVVIASQLRILIAEKEKSLIYKLERYTIKHNSPMLPRIKLEPDEVGESKGIQLTIDNLRDLSTWLDYSNKIPLEEWLQQVIAIIKVPYPLPKELVCSKCSNKITDYWNDKSKDVRLICNEGIIKFTCKCGTINTEYEREELTDPDCFIYFFEYRITMLDIIRSTADKLGGAHVDARVGMEALYASQYGGAFLAGTALLLTEVLGYKINIPKKVGSLVGKIKEIIELIEAD